VIALSSLERLLTVKPAGWADIHRSAIAAGCGRVVRPQDERLAAADELLALTVPEFAPLGALALLAGSSAELSAECASALSRRAPGVLRLVDRALAAHGRDNGYVVAAWLEQAYGHACARADAVAMLEDNQWPVSTLVDAAAEALTGVVIPLYRDRLGAVEGLADALGSLLVLHAAAAAGATDP
jgi:hypothetical protein